MSNFRKKNLNKWALNHVVWYTNHFSHWNTTKISSFISLVNGRMKIIDFQNSYFWNLLRPPLSQFSNFSNFLWVCWFLGKKLFNFVPPVWKLHNLYCHTVHVPKNIYVLILYSLQKGRVAQTWQQINCAICF